MQEYTRKDVMQAAKTFGKALAESEASIALTAAQHALKKDRQAQNLLSEYQTLQQAVQTAFMWKQIPHAQDMDALQRLEIEINTHPTLRALFDAQQQLKTTVETLNTEISDLLGIDFASNSRVGGCC
ncbi:hypothetical protein U27_03626 [Candidatus Vecturithrix granuli]|uniref:Uncharacterized protein n=1 Tax=Vecturithrix granuli TaxID=1499967 RepID=A0A081BWF8_VECG1|nr:hypothetical protein U27_03626 [Candidatus Vecturithrix granuli]